MPEGSDPSHGMAVTSDGKTLVVCSRLNNYLYFVLAAGPEGARRRRAHRQGRGLGDADARRQDRLRRQPGDQRRLGRRRQVDEGSRRGFRSASCRSGIRRRFSSKRHRRGAPKVRLYECGGGPRLYDRRRTCATMRHSRSVATLCSSHSLLRAGRAPGTAGRGFTVFEGARLITGDGSAPIENSASSSTTISSRMSAAAARCRSPAGAARVDLTGKTVMPTMVDLHGHIGFQNVAEGTMSKETYTRDNLIDHLQLLAYNGVGAVSRRRRSRRAVPICTAAAPIGAMCRCECATRSCPARRCSGRPDLGSRGRDPARRAIRRGWTCRIRSRRSKRRAAAVRDYVAMKPAFIKIWVDDRGGTKKTLTPPLYRAVVDEAHKYNVPVGVHNVTLANAKELMRAGVEGWLHVPVRGGESRGRRAGRRSSRTASRETIGRRSG